MSPTPVPGVGLVVVAAGRGERLGAGRPKALVEVAGRPLLAWALDGARAAGLGDVVVVAPPQALGEVRALAPGAVVVAGGETRQASVAAGLAALPPGDLVLVHDAARAFVPPQVFAAVVDALRAGADAVVPGVATADTLRHLDDGPVDRERVVAVQTPQGFRRAVLERAHSAGDPTATDDAGMVERLGVRVQVVPGSDEGFKVTRPLDVVLAEALLRSRVAP
jgi:2-C-methyl-D-erythritol 4-phosphate cytidylyltransferase